MMANKDVNDEGALSLVDLATAKEVPLSRLLDMAERGELAVGVKASKLSGVPHPLYGWITVETRDASTQGGPTQWRPRSGSIVRLTRCDGDLGTLLVDGATVTGLRFSADEADDPALAGTCAHLTSSLPIQLRDLWVTNEVARDIAPSVANDGSSPRLASVRQRAVVILAEPRPGAWHVRDGEVCPNLSEIARLIASDKVEEARQLKRDVVVTGDNEHVAGWTWEHLRRLLRAAFKEKPLDPSEARPPARL